MKFSFIIIIFFLVVAEAYTQPVLVEEFVEAAGLICFPVYGDTVTYRYLPSRGRLSTSEANLPEFSFLEYSMENKQAPVSGSSISEANGGGLLHFLVLYETPGRTGKKCGARLTQKAQA